MLPLYDEPIKEELNTHYTTCKLGLIRGVLMPNKTNNKVHFVYLSF